MNIAYCVNALIVIENIFTFFANEETSPSTEDHASGGMSDGHDVCTIFSLLCHGSIDIRRTTNIHSDQMYDQVHT